MFTPPSYPHITPNLVVGLGDFAEQVAQALLPEIEAAGPAVQAAVRWLRLVWPEAGRVRLIDQSGQVLLDLPADEPEMLVAIQAKIEEALRGIGLHATHERLVRAGYGLLDDPPASRRPRCYLMAALREAPVVATLGPLLAQLRPLLNPGHGPQSVAAFLNIASHSLDPEAPQRATVAAGLQVLSNLGADQPGLRLWPCLLLDWIKSGGIYAEGDEELRAALVALLRILLLADEPAARLQEACPLTALGESLLFHSLGVAVIQSPPQEAVLDWLAARTMAEFLSRRCLNPSVAPWEKVGEDNPPVADRLRLEESLKALAEGLKAEVTAGPGLVISLAEGLVDQSLQATEAAMARAGQGLREQISCNGAALKQQLLSETAPIGQLPQALAHTLTRGPHSLGSAEALLKTVKAHIDQGQAVLRSRLSGGSLRQERLAEQVDQSRAAYSASRNTLSEAEALPFRGGLVIIMLLASLFWVLVESSWGIDPIAGALLTTVVATVTAGFWYLFLKQRRLRRAWQVYLTALTAFQSAQVERAWLEAAQELLAATEAWWEGQTERLRTTRKLVEAAQVLLADRQLQLPSTPVIIETLPYLSSYETWRQKLLQEDPLMLKLQAALEKGHILADWPDLDPLALSQACLQAGQQALLEMPEWREALLEVAKLSVEEVLTNQGEAAIQFHLERLHHLATPLIHLNHSARPASPGTPSTLNIVCWEQGAAMRLQGRLREPHSINSTALATTGDTRRVTYIRLVPGFNLSQRSAHQPKADHQE